MCENVKWSLLVLCWNMRKYIVYGKSMFLQCFGTKQWPLPLVVAVRVVDIAAVCIGLEAVVQTDTRLDTSSIVASFWALVLLYYDKAS